MSGKCEVCKQQRQFLFSLVLTPDDDDDGDTYAVYVCGNCWDAIAEIAVLATNHKIADLEQRIKALEGANNA